MFLKSAIEGVLTAHSLVHASTISLPGASSYAARVDHLHDFLWWMSLFFLALVTFGMIYLVKKYHHSQKGRETAYILHNHKLEYFWTVVTLVLMLFVFAWGYRDYLFVRSERSNAVEINVVGRQWLWNFEYANGRKTMNELYVPKGRNIKLIMTSEDVLHSFYLPNFRLKQDVVPGMYTYIAFDTTRAGEFPIYCAEFCGTGHSDMLGKIFVLEEADYQKWLQTGKVSGIAKASGSGAPVSEEKPKSLAEQGAALYNSKGCFACHSTDGTPKVGPTHKGLFGKHEEMADGTKVVVDENYVRESIMEPQKKLVKGFPPSMPTFKGLLTDQEINALIAYLKSLN